MGRRAVWVGADGLVRMTVHELLDMHFHHVWTEIDAGAQDPIGTCGTACEWTGFTEWVSAESPRITLGWDWRLRCVSDAVVLLQDGEARTNVMLVDADNRDVGWIKNLQVLSTLVQAVGWAEPVQRALQERYS